LFFCFSRHSQSDPSFVFVLGVVLWTYEAPAQADRPSGDGNQFLGPLVIDSDGHVITMNEDGMLYVLNGQNGSLISRISVVDRQSSYVNPNTRRPLGALSPALDVARNLLVPSGQTLFQYHPDASAVRHVVRFQREISDLTISQGGLIYLACGFQVFCLSQDEVF
jgi:outer membrane protein assembly factor BamB